MIEIRFIQKSCKTLQFLVDPVWDKIHTCLKSSNIKKKFVLFSSVVVPEAPQKFVLYDEYSNISALVYFLL